MANQSPGNQTRTSFLSLDGVNQRDKALWVRAAQRAKKTLPRWVTDHLNQAALKEVPDWNQSRNEPNQK